MTFKGIVHNIHSVWRASSRSLRIRALAPHPRNLIGCSLHMVATSDSGTGAPCTRAGSIGRLWHVRVGKVTFVIEGAMDGP